MAQDLATAKAEFLAQVKDYAPKDVDELEHVLDDLIAWSEKQTGIKFEWHKETPGAKRQFLVKYCVPGMDVYFWAVYPRQADGAKLEILASPHARFPEALRDEARLELAGIDGRKPVPTGPPMVSLKKLVAPQKRQQVLDLMERLLARIPNEASIDVV